MEARSQPHRLVAGIVSTPHPRIYVECSSSSGPGFKRRLVCRSTLMLNHTRKNGVPSRTLTDNLTLRTRPLCALSYGDKESNPWPVSSTDSHPSLSGSAGPLELLRVQEFEYGTRVR